MLHSIKHSTIALTGLIAIALVTSCSATPESKSVDATNLGGPGEEAPLTGGLEDRASELSLDSGGIEVGTLLRSQQAHHVINGAFASSLEDLDMPVTTDNFDFQLINLDDQSHAIVAKPKKAELVAYAGGIHVGADLSQAEALITCASESGADIAPPTWADGQWSCSKGSIPAK